MRNSKVPRNIQIDMSDFAGCCAVVILYDFPTSHYNGEVSDDITDMSDDEWYNLIYSSCAYDEVIVTFADASGSNLNGNRGGCTPAKLAKWLRSKGEKVPTGAKAVNPDSGNTITLYSWAPSKAFLKKIDKYKNKKNNENAESGRGSRAAEGLYGILGSPGPYCSNSSELGSEGRS